MNYSLSMNNMPWLDKSLWQWGCAEAGSWLLRQPSSCSLLIYYCRVWNLTMIKSEFSIHDGIVMLVCRDQGVLVWRLSAYPAPSQHSGCLIEPHARNTMTKQQL
jgi:hypothetical protein